MTYGQAITETPLYGATLSSLRPPELKHAANIFFLISICLEDKRSETFCSYEHVWRGMSKVPFEQHIPIQNSRVTATTRL